MLIWHQKNAGNFLVRGKSWLVTDRVPDSASDRAPGFRSLQNGAAPEQLGLYRVETMTNTPQNFVKHDEESMLFAFFVDDPDR